VAELKAAIDACEEREIGNGGTDNTPSISVLKTQPATFQEFLMETNESQRFWKNITISLCMTAVKMTVLNNGNNLVSFFLNFNG